VNADTTGLLWKCLPIKKLARQSQLCVPGNKSSTKRVTVLCCTIVNNSLKIERKICIPLNELKAKIFMISIIRREWATYCRSRQGQRVSQALSQQK
jgi:hypothetical protein